MFCSSKVVHGKWIYDGCQSIEEMIRRLYLEAERMKQFQSDGWQLFNRVEDDYAFLTKRSCSNE